MRTLKRYIGREVLFATLLIFAALLMLFAFFDLIHELGDVGRGGYTITAALLYVLSRCSMSRRWLRSVALTCTFWPERRMTSRPKEVWTGSSRSTDSRSQH